MRIAKAFLLLAPVILSGCLTSQEPFSLPNENQTDDRLIGVYLNEKGQPFADIAKKSEPPGNYRVAVFSDDAHCSFPFVATLFQVGTNRFLDLVPVPQACDHVPGSPPGIVEILQAVTLLPLHMAVKVRPATNNQLEIGIVTQQGLRYAAEHYPELFTREEFPRMRPNTHNQREFLLKTGSDTNVFQPDIVKRRTSF